jgi:hypothetical protein
MEVNIFKLFSCILFASLLITQLSGCSTQAVIQTSPKYTISGISPAMGEVPEVSFEASASLPNFPDKLQVYKMVYPELNEEYMKNLGAKFGLTGEVLEDSSGFAMQNKETGAYLSIQRPTGTIKYDLVSYFNTPDAVFLKTPPILPPDAEALKIANDFLVDRDLLPKGFVASKVYVGDRFGNIPTTLLIIFKQAITTIGPGAYHNIRIGDGGKIVQVSLNMINPLDLPLQEMVAVKSVNQAYEEAKAGKDFYAPSAARKVNIDNVTIAYWLEAIDKSQDYVVPVFVFRGTCQDANGKQLNDPFGAIVEAVK